MKPHSAPAPHRWLTVGIVSLGASTGALDTSVNIAFPAMTAFFELTVPMVQWIVICYVLTYGSLLLGLGRLGDVIGHRRVFLWGVVWVAVGLWCCGWATTFPWLLGARALQGLGTALVLSCAPALVTLAFPEAERGKALGWYTMFSAVAATLGPLLGGYLVARWGWPAVFYFRVPLALGAAVLARRWLQQPVAVSAGQRFDGVGAVALTAAIAGVLLMLNRGQQLGWLALPTIVLGGSACGCVGFFVWHALRCPEPVLDVRLFRHPAFAIANLAHTLAYTASFAVLLFVPYYLLSIYHASPLLGGLLLAMSPCGTMLAAPLAGRLVTRIAPVTLSVGSLGVAAGGLWSVSVWETQTTVAQIAGTLLLQGVGLGVFQVANMDVVMGALPRHQQGVAGSLTLLTRTIGIVLGASLGSVVLAWLRQHYAWHLQTLGVVGDAQHAQAFLLAFQQAFQYAAALAAAAGLLIWSGGLAAKALRPAASHQRGPCGTQR